MFKDGLATKTDYVTVYNYNESGEFTGESTIIVEEGTGIPAQSTLEEVSKEKKGFARVFDKKWTYVEDHRSTEAYDINTKQKEEVKYLGALKPEHTTIAPPSHNHEFIDGAWIITDEKKAELERDEKEREINEIESQLDQVEKRIVRLVRIKQRTDSEEIELDELIDESTILFRTIEELKEGLDGY